MKNVLLLSLVGNDAIKPVVEKLYHSVKTGNEAQISIDSNSKPDYREKLEEELKALRESEMWQTAVTVRKLRPSYCTSGLSLGSALYGYTSMMAVSATEPI